MIELKNITIGFGERTILENVSCVFPESVTTVVVGPSGSGKSVLMKTIEGLVRPRGGEVWVDGEHINSPRKLREARRKLSMLFQGAALLDSMNVYQNVALPLVEHAGLPDAEVRRIVREKLALVGLAESELAMPAELSGGMRKRVGLARAIAPEPRYVIYDEPTTGLDPIIAAEIVRLIQKLRDTLGLTGIVVTHDLECIDRLAERIIMIADGIKQFEGSYADFRACSNPGVRAFLTGYGGAARQGASRPGE
jgi:phospholipid/cholesterol/gamma-HCH transport system ATP-binding protein